MKPKTMILMVVAVSCGLGASYMTSQFINARTRSAPAEQTVPVVVAKTRVLAWQQIKDPEKSFEIRQYLPSSAPKNALQDLNLLKDKQLKVTLVEGKPVSLDDVAEKGASSIDGALLPGQVAVSIKVNAETGIAGFVRAGSRVNVIWTTRGADARAEVLLQYMLVLAVDDKDTHNPDAKTHLAQTVTLAATDEEAAELSLAQQLGELRLVLVRNEPGRKSGRVSIAKGKLGKGGNGQSSSELEAKMAPPTPAVPLPRLDPDGKAPEEPKRVEVKREPPHILTIISGGSREKHAFHKDGDDEVLAGPAEPKKAEPKRPQPQQRPPAGKTWETGPAPKRPPYPVPPPKG